MQRVLTLCMNEEPEDCAVVTCPFACEKLVHVGVVIGSPQLPLRPGQQPEDLAERNSEVWWKVHGHWRHAAQSKAQLPCMLAVWPMVGYSPSLFTGSLKILLLEMFR